MKIISTSQARLVVKKFCYDFFPFFLIILSPLASQLTMAADTPSDDDVIRLCVSKSELIVSAKADMSIASSGGVSTNYEVLDVFKGSANFMRPGYLGPASRFPTSRGISVSWNGLAKGSDWGVPVLLCLVPNISNATSGERFRYNDASLPGYPFLPASAPNRSILKALLKIQPVAAPPVSAAAPAPLAIQAPAVPSIPVLAQSQIEASFDCADASVPIEKLICSRPETQE